MTEPTTPDTDATAPAGDPWAAALEAAEADEAAGTVEEVEIEVVAAEEIVVTDDEGDVVAVGEHLVEVVSVDGEPVAVVDETVLTDGETVVEETITDDGETVVDEVVVTDGETVVDETVIDDGEIVIDDIVVADAEGVLAEEILVADADGVIEDVVAIAVDEPEAGDGAPADDDIDPVEAFREAVRTSPGEWYVVHSYAGYENRVKANLESRIASLNMEDYIFQVEVPVEEVTEIKNGVRKQVKRNKFPGYVLVRADLTDESWGAVRHTPGVTGFVGHGHQPSPLSVDEVVSILAPKPEKKAGAPVEKGTPRVVDFEVGDPVTIIEGAFQTMQASISEINADTQKVIVMVELFGRETPVELTFSQIEKG